mmetsp:Transcript_32490/g.78866  ORF Transcript_32490/g.78866 Transcript_32490/m.78866 type:complete len:328 (+) Transcript_32490:389-1372(+)|eukprot:CAMPEP_0113630178 /NCGR_PEP_ID=MMETSP0017_2-20120614/15676_1 /TAXON_ID=2856 /ORGANISM="Cylindrotheca closterium" /LENGTH=327 /DNA_ID=CAMNT_0000540625 /DNA_START=294 /DNA_END=1277 /DNA_ORIENTATION=+ /assembly_acc=CAM_ASM_000147
MDESERKIRENGLQPAYSPAQVSTWVFLPFLLVEFALLASPLMPIAVSIPVTIVVFAFAGAATYYAYVTMSIDPADVRIFSNPRNRKDDKTKYEEPTSCSDDPTKHCWICEADVVQTSMHCKFCQKCVEGFDHHCMWLNTCIGKKNYHLFLKTMNFIILLLVSHMTVQIALIIDMYVNPEGTTRELSEEWLGLNGNSNTSSQSSKDATTLGVTIGMGAFIVMDLIALSLMLQLWHFHLRLRREKLTTYQFIVKDNQRRREARQLEEELDRKRDSAKAKALAEKRKGDYFKLHWGGILATKCGLKGCDPLRQEAQQDTKTGDEENGDS